MRPFEPTRFQLNEDDLVAAHRAHARWQLLRPDKPWVLRLSVVLFALLVILSAFNALLGSPWILIAVVTLVLLAPIVDRWVIPLMARRSFRSVAAFSRETAFWWDADEFHLESAKESASIPWTELAAVRRTPNALLLYRSPRLHHIIPMRALAEGEAHAIVMAYDVAVRSV